MKNNNRIYIFFALIVMLMFLGITMVSAESSVVSIAGPNTWDDNEPTLRLVNQNPDPAEPGSYVEVRWKVENIGLDESKDLRFEIIPEYPFSLDDGANPIRELGEVDSYQIGEDAYVIFYKLKVDINAVEGDNRIRLKYTAGDQAPITSPYYLRVEEHDFILGINEVNTVPKNAKPGEVVELNFELRNLASSEIKDIRVKVDVKGEDTPFAPVGSADEKVFKTIKANELKDIKFHLAVWADAQSKVHNLPITVSYSDKQGTEYEKEFIVGVKVFDEPSYIFNLEDTNVISNNQKGEVTFSISNIGIGEFKFLAAKLIATDDYKVLSTPTIYVGNLDSDDFETISYDIYTETENSKVPLKIELFYKDSYNKEYTDEISMNLNLYSVQDQLKYGFKAPKNYTAIVIIVLAIIGVATYIIYRRSKKGRR